MTLPATAAGTEFRPIFSSDYLDLATPGVVVEMTPDEAASLGAFEETAIDASEAWSANSDVGGA